jgi:hypothetical protein
MLKLPAGVMKWQTCQTQNLVGGNARVGSSPTAGKSQGLVLHFEPVLCLFIGIDVEKKQKDKEISCLATPGASACNSTPS